MRIFVTTCAVVGALALGGGAASAQNSTYCHNQAMAYAKQHTNTVAGGVLGGALGALGGVIAGDIIGQGKGAKVAGGVIGGTAGAVVGSSSQKKKQNRLYDEEYYRCMNTPAPSPVYYDIPPAGSPQWTYQCSLKYKSFDANSGTYQPLAQGGVYPPRRVCVLP
jgi:uncharacterized protein YcfJ